MLKISELSGQAHLCNLNVVIPTHLLYVHAEVEQNYGQSVVDRARRHCLWDKYDKEYHNSLAAWEMVCKLKEEEGLPVIINLKIQNDAVLMKPIQVF
jgi:hypothetical protein